AIEVAAGAVATAEWNEDALETAARRGFSTATGVADLLAQSGVPFRSAHEAVAEAAAEAEPAVAAAEYDEAVAVIDAAVEDVLGDSVFEWVEREALLAALDPVESVAARDSTGGPAPSATEAEVVAATEEIGADRSSVTGRRERLTTAAETLAAEVDEYV
ncbi:MAG: argininosuccinate lyase, partial [Halobaculum sp.]